MGTGEKAEIAEGAAQAVTPSAAPPLPKHNERRSGRRDRALGFRLFLVLLGFALIAAGFSLRVKPLTLPVLIVAEVEDRLNVISQPVLPGARVSLGGIALSLNDSWAPVLRLLDLRLLQSGGGDTVLALPEAEMLLDGGAFVQGKFMPKRLKLSGAQLDLRRDRDGRIDLVLGDGSAPAIRHLGDVFDGLDLALKLKELSALQAVEFDALSLSLHDDRLGRSWVLGDGRLVAENREMDLAAELSISFLDHPGASARMTAVSAKGSASARVRAEISGLPAAELAAQHPVLAWLSSVSAPISGEISLTLKRGGIAQMAGKLDLGEGALRPGPAATPIAFTKAGLKLSYDSDSGRIGLADLEVQSKSVRAQASGQVYLLDAAGEVQKGVLSGRNPSAILGQLTFKDVLIDPDGQFDQPVQFAHGALDMRLKADPFSVEIGQFTLSDGLQRLLLSGTAEAGSEGWNAALDVAVNEISVERLVQLWPLNLMPKTRVWAASNLLSGNLSDVNGVVRVSSGSSPRLHLDYDFNAAEIRFLPFMPTIQGASGYSVIDDTVNTVMLSRGVLRPPEGGEIDLSGTTMRIADVYARPAIAQVAIKARGPAIAMLSTLDQKPFEFLKKAGRPVALGSGDAVLRADIRTPLAKGILPGDVDFTADAQVTDFASSVLVDGRSIDVPQLVVTATPLGLKASGAGTIDTLPFDAVYDLPFGSQAGPARISGTAEVSDRAVRVFDLGLPEGMVKGASSGTVSILLPKGSPAQFDLQTDLIGTRLAIPELGWSKEATRAARLSVNAVLTSPPEVTKITLDAPALSATGSVELKADGGLDIARIDSVTMGGWLDGAATISGGNPLQFAVTSGSIDFREFPGADRRSSAAGGSANGAPLRLQLQEFRVTDGIRLNDFQGDFRLNAAGVEGQFSAMLGGSVPLSGGVAPSQHGTAVRALTDNAGGAFRAAGIFETARGGALDLTLTPRAEAGIYDGRADITDLRVIGGNVLADLLNSISVIGLLEQLNGDGIVFTKAEADFVLTPYEVTVRQSSAVGASMGVSMEGTYQAGSGALRMGGVISPIYILNGIGAVLTRKGEGLFGFTYRLGGTADAPEVGVNPLSILTPGMFRDIFRMPAAPERPAAP